MGATPHTFGVRCECNGSVTLKEKKKEELRKEEEGFKETKVPQKKAI